MKIRLKYWRQRKVLSQRELANRAGVNVNTIGRIEDGLIPYPSTLRKLADALGISVEELVIVTESEEDKLLAKVG